jgi:flavin-dependent dehydrogenase
MSGLPEGLLAFGDAISSFNPTFGQGITVAARQAVLLRELLATGARAGFERAFLKRASKIVDVAWNMSVGRLFLYPGVTGKPSLRMRLANLYMPKVVARAQQDVVVAGALLEAMQFVAPPESLFSPRLLLRVFGLYGTLGTWKRRQLGSPLARGARSPSRS